MKALVSALRLTLLLCSGLGFAQARTGFAGTFHDARLKLISLPDRPIAGDSHSRVAEGGGARALTARNQEQTV